jgi:hypothetical protein
MMRTIYPVREEIEAAHQVNLYVDIAVAPIAHSCAPFQGMSRLEDYAHAFAPELSFGTDY